MQFVDLKHQYQLYREEILGELEQVMESAAFIQGPALRDLEAELASYVGVRHAIGCSSGTDALILGLMALEVQRGDEIIVPDFSFIATAETVALMGATPVFVDVQADTFNMDPAAVRAALTERTVGIIPVSLYGQIADMAALNAIAAEAGIWVMEDGAQSFGATQHGAQSGALSRVGTTSFFPAKPLGAYGDAGAVFTDDDDLAQRIRMLLNHGQRQRYDHAIVGLNARMDTLQAAVLKVKLRHFEDEIAARNEVADRYTSALAGSGIPTPTVVNGNTSVWAQYTVRVANRDTVRAHMQDAGIPTAVHYPIPLRRQDALSAYAVAGQKHPVTDAAAAEVMSLPMHPFLSSDDISAVTRALVAASSVPAHA